MTNELEVWLKQAARHLSQDSAEQVRREILEHYESAREAAMSGGSTAEAADRIALTALGDAKTANRQYRRVLLTSSEAKTLREGNKEARRFCANSWMKWLLLSAPAAALLASIACFLTGKTDTAKGLLTYAFGLAVWAASPFLPVYTPTRGRILRFLKWAVLATMLVMVFQLSWLFISCLSWMVWIEWTRSSIRRKIPVAQWPKQLYL